MHCIPHPCTFMTITTTLQLFHNPTLVEIWEIDYITLHHVYKYSTIIILTLIHSVRLLIVFQIVETMQLMSWSIDSFLPFLSLIKYPLLYISLPYLVVRQKETCRVTTIMNMTLLLITLSDHYYLLLLHLI